MVMVEDVTDISQMTSFLTFQPGQNAINSGKRNQSISASQDLIMVQH
jgi:hypothetical protein